MKDLQNKESFTQLRAQGLSFDKTSTNPALALILQKNKVLENEKTGQILFEESLSGELPMTGLEPALSCLK